MKIIKFFIFYLLITPLVTFAHCDHHFLGEPILYSDKFEQLPLEIQKDLRALMYFRGKSLSRYSDMAIKTNEHIVALTQKMHQYFGIKSEKYEQVFHDKEKSYSYSALKLLPDSNGHPVNKIVFNVSQKLYNIDIYFSPFLLSEASSMALFKTDGSVIFSSYDFALGKADSPSFWHEVGHAETYYSILNNQETIFGGKTRVFKGFLSSKENRSGAYSRFAAGDEVKQTVFSLQEEIKLLLALKKKFTNVNQFYNNSEAELLISSIYSSVTIASDLTQQEIDLAKRSLANIGDLEIINGEMKLGHLRKSVSGFLFKLDSYSQKLALEYEVHPLQTHYQLYSERDIEDVLRDRIEIYQKLHQELLKVKKSIGLTIVYPRLEKTNFVDLENDHLTPYLLLKDL